MAELRVAKRYTSALFELARRADCIDQVERDLREVETLLARVPQVRQVLNHPVIPEERKKQILRETLQQAVGELTLHFLDLLVDKRRTEVLDAVPGLFHAMADQFRGVVEARVRSAVPLPADQQARLAERLSMMTGKQIRLVVQVDPKLIGGLMVRIGDTVMDGSVIGQLEQIRQQLMARP